MSKRVSNIPVIEGEPDFICFMCGKVAETRPYGPNGEELCFECAMKDEKETSIQLDIRLFGATREQAEANYQKSKQKK